MDVGDIVFERETLDEGGVVLSNSVAGNIEREDGWRFWRERLVLKGGLLIWSDDLGWARWK